MDLVSATRYAEMAVGIGLVTYMLWRQTIQKQTGPPVLSEKVGLAIVVLIFCGANAIQEDWLGVGMWLVVAVLFYARWRRGAAATKPGLFEPPSPD